MNRLASYDDVAIVSLAGPPRIQQLIQDGIMTHVREIPETITSNPRICYRNRHPLAGNKTVRGDDEVRLKVLKSIGKYLSNAGIRKWY